MPYNSDHTFVTPTYSGAGNTELTVSWAGGNNAKVLNIPESIVSGLTEINLGSSVGNTKPLVINVIESDGDEDDDITLDLDLPPLTPSTYKFVLYNFTNTEGTITIERDISGTIFAPFATVVTKGEVHGAVIAKQWTHEGGLVENGTNHVFNATIEWAP